MLSNLLNQIKMMINHLKANIMHAGAEQTVEVHDWHYRRYEKSIIQRNILFVGIVVCFIMLFCSLLTIIYISGTRKIEPLLVQVEEKTGITKVVVPMDTKLLSAEDALAKYMIKRYIIARETYNPVDYETISKRTIKLMSSNAVYRQYRGYLRDKDNDPSVIYGANNSTSLNIRSWSKIDRNKYIVRFSVIESQEQLGASNKIAVVEIAYVAMELNDSDLDINPVGMQVIGYRVDGDNS